MIAVIIGIIGFITVACLCLATIAKKADEDIAKILDLRAAEDEDEL